MGEARWRQTQEAAHPLAGRLETRAALPVLVPRLDGVAVALAIGGAAAWLLSNAPAEDVSLVEPFHGNGITVADLAVVAAAGLVLLLSARRLFRE